MIEDRIGMSSLTIMIVGCDGDDRMLCELDKEIIPVVIHKMVNLCIAVRNQGNGKNNTLDITLDWVVTSSEGLTIKNALR